MRRKVYSRARRVKRWGASGGMMVTRNTPAGYFAPATTLGSYVTCAESAGNPISNIGWQFGAATSSGGLVAGIYDVPFVYGVQLAMLYNSGDFTTLFDQYQIRSVTHYITVSQTASSVLGAGSAGTADSMLTMPSIAYFIDKDDYSLPNQGTVRERMGVRMKQLQLGKTVKITIRNPKCEGLVYSGSSAVVGSAIPKGYQWLDTSANTVPHYGLKGILKGVDLRPRSEALYQITIETKVKLALKQVK